MELALDPANEKFIERELADGVHRDHNEAVNAAIEYVRQRKELLAHLDEAESLLQNGQYTDYDATSLREFFDDVSYRMELNTATPANIITPTRQITRASQG